MRIGIDGGCLANRRGFGRFARELLRALAEAGSRHEFVVILDRPSVGRVVVPGSMEVVPVDVRVAPSVAAAADGRRRVGDMLAMGRAAARARLDALFFPASYSFFPAWNVGRVVVTMHDTLALAHPDLVFPGGKGRLAWRLKERVAAWSADRIVTVSEAARRDLAAWYRLPEGRIRVITEGPDAAFGPIGDDGAADEALRRYGIDPAARFLLAVGGLSPHKNLPRLIEAFDRAVDRDGGDRLVIVGDFADVFCTEIPRLRELVERLDRESSVHFTGFVPDVDLAHFYRRARALIQPSLMEGFGLPTVEAMVSGTPVLSSTAGSLPEVVGPAGIFFDPLDVGAMAGAIRQVLGDPATRDRLARAAPVQAARFTWARSARLLLDCFDELDRPASVPGRPATPAGPHSREDSDRSAVARDSGPV